MYNEVLLRRYSENGVSKKPDYIIVEDGKISEVALRHAAYFHIPIINIDNSIYAEKARKHGIEIMDSISEKDDYLELDRKLSDLFSIANFKQFFIPREGIGRKYDILKLPPYATAFDKKFFEISRFEQLKRLDFIKGILSSETERIRAATERGVRVEGRPKQLESFNIDVDDVQNNVHYNSVGSSQSWRAVPGNCSSIIVNFKLKDSSRYVETKIYDGENLYEPDKVPPDRAEDAKEGDSSFYHALEPIALQYLAAVRANHML